MDHLPQRSPEALKRQAETTRKGRSRPANLREQVCEETVKMWSTPTQMDAHGLEYNLRKDATETRSILLSQKVAMFPTPTTRDYKSPDMNPDSKRFSQKTELNSTIGGQLNPTWVEWLMGFPIGWTDLNA
jgi:hypothetical protein